MNIPFEVVDVLNDPGGRERLLALGQRRVPILARGKDYVYCVDLNAVARFVGIADIKHRMLPPEVLIERMLTVLRKAQGIVRQIPPEKLLRDAIPNRKRDLRLLSHQVFRIGEAWVEVAAHGEPFTRGRGEKVLADGEFTTTEEIARYGEHVVGAVERWWATLKEADRVAFFARPHAAYFGPAILHALFERSTWHSAQHTRQLTAVLEELGITPAQRLEPADLAGLPLPERLWE